MVEGRDKYVGAFLTLDQYNLVRRRMFVEDQRWQTLIPALINAYIMGDISVRWDGRYKMSPPTTYAPVVEVDKGHETIDLEPNWGKPKDRPQFGMYDPDTGNRRTEREVKNEGEWNTRQAAEYLRTVTGRRIKAHHLRSLLKILGVPKQDNGFWKFTGENDPAIQECEEAIVNGLFDAIVRSAVNKVEEWHEVKANKDKELEAAFRKHAEDKRVSHLRKLRGIEES